MTLLFYGNVVRFETFQETLVSAAIQSDSDKIDRGHICPSDDLLPARRLDGAAVHGPRIVVKIQHPPARRPVFKVAGSDSMATDDARRQLSPEMVRNVEWNAAVTNVRDDVLLFSRSRGRCINAASVTMGG
jgi:hypothetical protein